MLLMYDSMRTIQRMQETPQLSGVRSSIVETWACIILHGHFVRMTPITMALVYILPLFLFSKLQRKLYLFYFCAPIKQKQ